MTDAYLAAYQRATKDPTGFWGEAATLVDWIKTPDTILDQSQPPQTHWFADGVLNTSANCLDRHVAAGRGNNAAILYDSPVTGVREEISYETLLDRVSRFAGALRNLGVEKGDRVILYMPMVPEALVGMLACARLGAVHSVVFGGFAAHELAARIDDAKPRVVLSASCGIEPSRIVPYKPLLDEALAMAGHKVAHTVILARPQFEARLEPGRDHDWAEAEARGVATAPVPVLGQDPLYILYTSGTTGSPKGIVRDNGGHAVALSWSMKNIYDVGPGEVFWAASDIGWVVGHSYIVYAPLLVGATTVLYEGKPVGTPDAAAYWRLIERYGVRILFTAPTAIRAIRQQDPECRLIGDHDTSSLAALYVAGERCDTDTLHWAERHLQKPVIDHWWQTETGWAITANCRGLGLYPVHAGSPGRPVPGYQVTVVDEHAEPVAPGVSGSVVIKLPLPPGCFTTLWGHDEAFAEKYLREFPGYYKTGDAGYVDEDGYLYIMSRTDDVINVAGHRLSTGALEEVLGGHADVAECAVFGVNDDLKGQVPLGLVVLKSGVSRDHADIAADLVARVRSEIGPVADFKRVGVVKRLPKTRSGKILRGSMQKLANGETFPIPATIDDPAVLDEIAEALIPLGYGRH